jgi:hypothetical protein
MDIAHYNKLPSRIDFQNEAYSMYVTSLLAESIVVRSCMSAEFLAFLCQDMFDDSLIVESLKFHYKDNNDFITQLERTQDLILRNKKIAHLKHKNKLDLVALGKYRTLINTMRKTHRTCVENRMKHFKLMELVPFIEDRIWLFDMGLYPSNEQEEDPYIPELTTTLSEHEYILSLDAVVEELFQWESYDAEENNTVDFIKIPLWKFPMFADITYPQLKHIRNELKTALSGFNDQLKQLTGQLWPLQFIKENKTDIKRLCYDTLKPFVQTIQKTIDENIYISRLKNSTADTTSITFCLGITSVENIIQYFVKAEMVEPYVVTEINQQLSRQLDVRSTFIFSYILVK